VVYLTDSGDGAIIVLNLKTGISKRLLDKHYSTESEVDSLICDGIVWKNTVHSDGIGLSNDRAYLYYVALTGHTLYRIPTKVLRDTSLTEDEIFEAVEKVAKIPATDGIMFDKKGNLWLGGLEDNSINVLLKDKTLKKYHQHPSIRWADSFAKDIDGNIYFTTSQIHLPEKDRKQYQLFRINNPNLK
jgi:sugar lactone lactonase YvrE